LNDFKKIVAQFDPHGKFRNDFLERIFMVADSSEHRIPLKTLLIFTITKEKYSIAKKKSAGSFLKI